MPKENRRSVSRKSKRQCLEGDDDASTVDGWTPSKPSPAVGTKRYSPFQRLTPRRESRSDEEMLALTEARLPNTKNGGIIESGFKYIMFMSLHLLQLCTQFGIGPKSIVTHGKSKNPSKDEAEVAEEKTTSVRDTKKSEASGVCNKCQRSISPASSTSRKSEDSSRDSDRGWKDDEGARSRKIDASKSDDHSSARRDNDEIARSSKKFCDSRSEESRANDREANYTPRSSDKRASKWDNNCTGSRQHEDRSAKHEKDRTPRANEDRTPRHSQTSSSKSVERVESKSKQDDAVPKESHGSRSDRDGAAKVKEERSNYSEKNRKEYSPKTEKDRSPRTKKDKRTETKDQYSMISRRSPRRNLNYDSDESSDEMVTAAEDSDSSNERWSSANSTMLMNMSVDPESFINEISMMEQSEIAEPMDISMEEPIFGRTYTVLRTPRDLYLQQNSKVSEVNTFSDKPISQASSTSSIDEEIARIFQKQCTSSDDEYSSSSTQRSGERLNKPRSTELQERKVPSRAGAKSVELNDKESHERKKSVTRDVDDRKKIVEEDKVKEKSCDRKSDANRDRGREEKYESSQRTPSKHRSRTPRTPVKSKDTKRRESKYRERGTQTDSAFSDEDVEMIPIDASPPDKRTCCRSSGRKSRSNICQQNEKMDQDLNYVADNEDSNDGSVKFARSRISSESASSTSTSDHGFEERARFTPDIGHRVGGWQNFPTEVRGVRASHEVHVTRAPPGFPKIPQNPPFKFCNCILATTVTNDVKHRSTLTQVTQSYARAPTPMRHLYHEYPEFMISTDDINASKILRNIYKKDRIC